MPLAHGVRAIQTGRFFFFHPGQRAVVAVIQPRGIHHRQIRLLQRLLQMSQRGGGAFEHGADRKIEHEARLTQLRNGAPRMSHAGSCEADIDPAGEPVLTIPFGLAVTQQYQGMPIIVLGDRQRTR